MYLLELHLTEFGQFVQIVLWISLPFTILCLVIATILHYRRKKVTRFGFDLAPHEGGLEFSSEMVPAPMLRMNVMSGGDEKQYEQQLYKTREKYQQLEGAFRKLQEEYSAQFCKVQDEDEDNDSKEEITLLQSKVTSYENEITQLQQSLKEMEQNNAIIESNNELQEKYEKVVIDLNNLQAGFQELSSDNQSLKVQLDKKEDEIIALTAQLKQLPTGQPASSAEINGLRDIVNEKKAHIDFLQNQLDHRIQAFHQSEQRSAEVKGTITQLQEEANRLQSNAHELLKRAENVEQNLYSQNITVGMLQNRNNELQQENTTLFETIADTSHHVNQLEEELTQWKQRAKSFEEKWEQNSLLISRIYRELTLSVGNESAVNEPGAIITIRENGQGEMAVA